MRKCQSVYFDFRQGKNDRNDIDKIQGDKT